jgi:predicted dehydrogenase
MTAAHDPAPLSNRAVGWGILATGGIAQQFARDLALHGHRIAAVGSRSLGNAQRFADDFDIPNAHGSYEDLVADPEVDAVYVATPHTFHAAQAIAALDHDKHVLVEKSFTIDALQARSVVDRARDRRRIVMEAMWTRFLPHMAFVREAVTNGRIGAIRSVHADHTQQLPSDPAHRLNDLKLGGGALLDLGVYPLSFAHDLLGPPTEITARAVLGPTGADTSVATILRHAGDTVSTSYSSMETHGSNTATVLGTDGRLEIAATWYAPTVVTLHDAHGDVVERFDQPVSGRGMQYQATEVERLIEAGETESPLMTPAGSVEVMETMDQIRTAIGVHYPEG